MTTNTYNMYPYRNTPDTDATDQVTQEEVAKGASQTEWEASQRPLSAQLSKVGELVLGYGA